MRKFISFFLVLILIILSSCSDEASEDDFSQMSKHDESRFAEDSIFSKPDESKVVSNEVIDVEILKKEEQRGDIQLILMYPALSKNHPDMETVNSDILSWCEYKYDLMHLSAMPEDNMKYEVTEVNVTLACELLISAIVKGRVTTEEENHEDVFIYTINYDLLNKTIIESKNIISDIEKFKNVYKTSDLNIDYGMNNILNNISLDDMLSLYNDEFQIFPEIYFTPDRVGGAFPVAFSLGGVSCISVSYGKARSFINDNEFFSKIYS